MNWFSMRDFARPLGYRSRLLMLSAYFDDSGTHDAAPVVVWGGVAGDAESFDYLDRKWREQLAAPARGCAPISMFHLTKCKAKVDEFAGWSDANRDSARHDFRQIIVESGVAVVAFGVDTSAWRGLVTEALASEMRAESMAFGLCVKAMIEAAEQSGERVDVKFDYGRERQNVDTIHEARALYPKTEDLTSFGWVTAKAATGIQAADTVAHEFYDYASAWVKDPAAEPGPHLAHFRDQYGPDVSFHAAMMGEAEIRSLLDHLAADGR